MSLPLEKLSDLTPRHTIDIERPWFSPEPNRQVALETLAEYFSNNSPVAQALQDHIDDPTAAHAASAISFSPGGGISSTTTQGAIAELDTDKAPKDSPVFTGDLQVVGGEYSAQLQPTSLNFYDADLDVSTTYFSDGININGSFLSFPAGAVGTFALTSDLAGYQPLASALTAYANAADAAARRALFTAIGYETNAANFTAKAYTEHIVTASATITHPTPAQGMFYRVFVRNGTATMPDASTYSVAGTLIAWVYHSGAWSKYVRSAETTTGAAAITASDAAALRDAAGATAGVFPAAVLDLSGRVPTTRTVSTTAPLAGGGALSGNLTLTVNAATDAAAGVVELATPAEVTTGTDTVRAVTPAGSKAALDAREALVLERLATREASDWLWSDGVTSNRAQIQIPGPRGNLAGAAVASWVGWVDVPTSNPSANAYIFALSSLASGDIRAAHSLSCYITTGGDLTMDVRGATTGDVRTRGVAALRSTYSGQRVWLEVRFTSGSADYVVRVNGTALTISAPFVAGSPPAEWLPATIVATHHLTGYNWPTGTAPLSQWLNAHLTDAESEAWRMMGRPPAWVGFGGSMQELIAASQDRDFSGVGTGNWNVLIAAASVANTVNALDITLAGSGASGVRLAAAAVPYNVPGALVRVRFTATLVSGSTVVMRCGFNGGTELLFTPTGSPVEYTGDIVASINNQLTLYTPSSSSQVVRIDNISIRYIGALSLPVVQPIAALGDGTVLGDNPSRLVGIQPVTTRKDWQLTARTSTSGNEQILGGSFLDTTRDVLGSIEQTPETGTPTTTVGSASAGAQYKASGALAAGINTPALVTRKTASANVWVGSSTADPVRTTITGHSR